MIRYIASVYKYFPIYLPRVWHPGLVAMLDDWSRLRTPQVPWGERCGKPEIMGLPVIDYKSC